MFLLILSNLRTSNTSRFVAHPEYSDVYISPRNRQHLGKVFPLAFSWLIFGFIYALLEKGIIGDATHYPSTNTTYAFGYSLPIILISSSIAGLLHGFAEVYLLRDLFVGKTFGRKLFLKSLIYLIFIVLFLSTTALFLNSLRYAIPLNSYGNFIFLKDFISSFSFWSIAIYIAVITSICLFFIEMKSNLGQGVVLNYLMGRYHRPREEERVFMFLDMKSSTRIAEHLGHVRYFELLKDYYADMTEAILSAEGQVYQYVGDEIVISWAKDKGLKKSNCLVCFFDIELVFQRKRDFYEKTYGLVPAFKAGIHCGKVTAGEIGVLKKEIIYTGDVLNTTARIQGLCNYYETTLLVSRELLFVLPRQHRTLFHAIGELQLEGKLKKMVLYRKSIQEAKDTHRKELLQPERAK